MGTKLNPGTFDCYGAAEDNEPMFVLLARDESAPNLIEAWAHERLRKVRADLYMLPPETMRQINKILEAFTCAHAMREWRKAHR